MENLDKKLNYRALFEAIVEKATIRGDSMIGCCPVHRDKKPSFSVDLKTGLCHCFACGWQGNYVSLYAELHNMDTKEAYKAILEENNLDEKPEPKKAPVYTFDQYCQEKHFDPSWLRAMTGMGKQGTDRSGEGWVEIPYFDESNKKALFRKRYAKTATTRFKWGAGSAGKLMLYGEWTLEDIRKEGWCVLVEGESDAQTLWLLGFPCLGVPGASVYRPEWTERLNGLKLYIHVEPDHGGQTFLDQMRQKLFDGGFTGEAYTWTCGPTGKKDPSDVYLAEGIDKAAGTISGLLDKAEPLSMEAAEVIPCAIPDAPLHLRTPAGWIFNDSGIHKIDKHGLPVNVCRTPVILTKRLQAHDSGEEKVELAFKRDGRWISSTHHRTTAFVARSVVELAKLGATVTSENAKSVVAFLSALEAENIDLIPTVDSTSTLGWQPGGRFIPWHAEDMVLDVSPQMMRWANACQKAGTLEAWAEAMAPHRERYRFRFILAASFTAPLLRIIKGRSFVVYNWASSRGGKTAALKAALSAWGDPDRLMLTFNSTRVAFERMASFFCDMPLGIDERQLAGSQQEGLETLIYMMSNGVSRGRGTRDGGLQDIQTWRTVAMTTGEEPITKATTMTGVSTRTLEIIGAPFDHEVDAAEMHRQTAENTGHAGDLYLRHLITTPERETVALYQETLGDVKTLAGDRNGSHVASLAAVATADRIISRLIFGEDETEARGAAMVMVRDVLEGMAEDELPDVNISAAQFIVDWIEMNRDKSFKDEGTGPRYGFLENGRAYILSTPLRVALEQAGFSYRKSMKWLKDEGVIAGIQDSGADRNTIKKRHGQRTFRVVPIDLEALEQRTSRVERQDMPF